MYVYVKSPDRLTLPCDTHTDVAKNVLRITFHPTIPGVYVIEIHSLVTEYRKHGSLESSLVARFAVQAENKKAGQVSKIGKFLFLFLTLTLSLLILSSFSPPSLSLQAIQDRTVHVYTQDDDEILSRYQLDGTVFCVDFDSGEATLNDLRRKLNANITERAAAINEKQRATLSRWLDSFEFYALDEENKILLLSGSEKAENFSYLIMQANRMAVFKTDYGRELSEEGQKAKMRRRMTLNANDMKGAVVGRGGGGGGGGKGFDDFGPAVQGEKHVGVEMMKKDSKTTVVQLLYKMGPNRWTFDVNYPNVRVVVGKKFLSDSFSDFSLDPSLFFFCLFLCLSYSLTHSLFLTPILPGGYYDIFVKVRDPYQGGMLVNDLGKNSKLEAHIIGPNGEVRISLFSFQCLFRTLSFLLVSFCSQFFSELKCFRRQNTKHRRSSGRKGCSQFASCPRWRANTKPWSHSMVAPFSRRPPPSLFTNN